MGKNNLGKNYEIGNFGISHLAALAYENKKAQNKNFGINSQNFKQNVKKPKVTF